MKVCGGLMLAESERDIEFLKGKIALEKSRGIEAELIGANELRALEPCIGDAAIAAEWCPGEGKINPLKGTYAVVARAKALGARFRRGSNVQAIERDGTQLEGHDQPRRDPLPGGSSMRRGRGRPRSRRMAGVDIPGARRAAADGRDRADGADAVAAGRLCRPPSHAEADGLGRLHDRRRLDGGPRRAAEAVARAARQRRGQSLDRQPRGAGAGRSARHPHLGRHERQHRPRADPGRGARPAGLLQLRQLQRLHAGAGAGAAHGGDDRRPLDQPAGRALFDRRRFG